MLVITVKDNEPVTIKNELGEIVAVIKAEQYKTGTKLKIDADHKISFTREKFLDKKNLDK